MSVRLRFALLYAGAFLVSGLLIIALVFFAVSSTHAGRHSGIAGGQAPVRRILRAGRRRRRQPGRARAAVGGGRLAARGPAAPPGPGDHRDRAGHLREQPEQAAADRPPRRRVHQARRDAERAVREAGGVVSGATALRRQRLARAAHPAHRGANPAAGGARRPRCRRGDPARRLRAGPGAWDEDRAPHRRPAHPRDGGAGHRAAWRRSTSPASRRTSSRPAPRRPASTACGSTPGWTQRLPWATLGWRRA